VDADLSLEVTAPSLGGGRREKIQEKGSDMDLKNCYSRLRSLTEILIKRTFHITSRIDLSRLQQCK